MKVKLISHSQSPEQSDTLLDLVAYCARVSNPSNQNNKKTAEKLVEYLIQHKHWSPLEMVNMCLEIETTRDIARQMLRHRSFSFQEFSQRYAEPESMGYPFELREVRLQDPDNRQNSIENTNEELQYLWLQHQRKVLAAAQSAYDWAIKNGIAKEQARCVLPEGNTKSRMYVNGTLRSWIHYIELRSANGTQLEHMDLAVECASVISKVFPLAADYVADD
jgi:thymidylate synthase (FAD)